MPSRYYHNIPLEIHDLKHVFSLLSISSWSQQLIHSWRKAWTRNVDSTEHGGQDGGREHVGDLQRTQRGHSTLIFNQQQITQLSTFLLVGKSTIYIPSTYILGTIAGAEVVTPYQQLPSRYQNSNLHNTSHAIRHVTDETSKHLSNIWQISQAFSNNSFCRARRWDFGIQYSSVIYILGFFQRFALGPSA